MKKIRITRTLTIPNPTKIMRFQRHPELGPKLLFFSGGSALTNFCETLKGYTHNSIHIVTPFDSGEVQQNYGKTSRCRLLAICVVV
ncbi:hypothetical protein RS130_19875 [Paraglaciecola aquimarina]|uniref:Uncharacterized protein n=1 Tax=Paraglaciecola aquimarina TaxID=1235557 RepID=A0ABU3T0Y5_9ALTE|nr:hypothetical protein [Paraglaciecola aquimarina]MDU0355842.1 hypothetical protein [Paraglaciecola aquimarina]